MRSDTSGVDETDSPPIRALLFDDASLVRLDGFVAALGESIDTIQDNEHGGQLEETAKRAADLARDAHSLGLPQLATAAERVVACCQDGKGAGAHAAIVELTDVVRRVRLGHRPTL
jgi:hypothetical protein